MSSQTKTQNLQNEPKRKKKSKQMDGIRRRELITAYIFLMPALLSIITFVFIPIFFALLMSFFKNPTAGDLGDNLIAFYSNLQNLNKTSFYEFFINEGTSIFDRWELEVLTYGIIFLIYLRIGYKKLSKVMKLNKALIALIVVISGLFATYGIFYVIFKFIPIYFDFLSPLENYRSVFTLTQLDFLQILFNTIFWTVICVFFHVALGILLAVLMNQDFAGKGFFRGVFIIPWAIPSFASTLIWKNFIFNANGFLGQRTDQIFPNGEFYFNVGNLLSLFVGALALVLVMVLLVKFIESKILKDKSYRVLLRFLFMIIAIPVAWMVYQWINPLLGGTANNLINYDLIAIPNTTLNSFWISSDVFIFERRFIMITFSAILINIWLGVPFMMVSFLAAMQGIPQDLYEAAEIDGADSWNQFKSITIPLIKPTLFTVSLLGFIWTFNLFNVVYILAQGQNLPNNRLYSIFVTFIYDLFDGSRDYARAAALSFIVFILLTVFSRAYRKIFNPDKLFIGEEDPIPDLSKISKKGTKSREKTKTRKRLKINMEESPND
ncbi:MAG: carbohydrate ABC transporter permease [Promethearchaeota archaeon]